MKHIEEEYQRMLSEQRYTYERIISNLQSHIGWLEGQLKEHEKDPLEKEIEATISAYNDGITITNTQPFYETESQSSELQKQIDELKKENRGLKISNGHLKSAKKVKRAKRVSKKNALCFCKDCKKYFQACRKDAQRCADCKRKHATELTKISRAKRKM